MKVGVFAIAAAALAGCSNEPKATPTAQPSPLPTQPSDEVPSRAGRGTVISPDADLGAAYEEKYPEVTVAIRSAAKELEGLLTPGAAAVVLATWAHADTRTSAANIARSDSGAVGFIQFSRRAIESGTFEDYGIRTVDDALDTNTNFSAAAKLFKDKIECASIDPYSFRAIQRSSGSMNPTLFGRARASLVTDGLLGGETMLVQSSFDSLGCA